MGHRLKAASHFFLIFHLSQQEDIFQPLVLSLKMLIGTGVERDRTGISMTCSSLIDELSPAIWGRRFSVKTFFITSHA